MPTLARGASEMLKGTEECPTISLTEQLIK